MDLGGRPILDQTCHKAWNTEMDSHSRKFFRYFDGKIERMGKQCRERWHNHLKPDINKDEWT